MAGRTLQLDAFVLLKRPATDKFQGYQVFSASEGSLVIFQRLAKKSATTSVALDLFDEASLELESSNEGRTWFTKGVTLLRRPVGIGGSYETLLQASALARLIARNPVHEETREAVANLLRAALAAFDRGDRPDVIYFKSLYKFARDEGYPVKEQWFASLPAATQKLVATLLNQPVAEQEAEPDVIRPVQRSLENYLRGHTEVLLD